jgi:hypothetical protein
MADRKLDTEFVFEGDEIGGVPSNIDKKRPRPGTLSLACDRCRKRVGWPFFTVFLNVFLFCAVREPKALFAGSLKITRRYLEYTFLLGRILCPCDLQINTNVFCVRITAQKMRRRPSYVRKM